MFVRRKADEPRVFEITFMNQLSWQEEKLHLYAHEVEFRKLVDALNALLEGRTDQAGAEGVYVSFGEVRSGTSEP